VALANSDTDARNEIGETIDGVVELDDDMIGSYFLTVSDFYFLVLKS
jgi:hypothetical protein